MQNQISLSTPRAGTISSALQLAAAFLLGAVVLYAAGFLDTTHAAAHDTRHAVSFPCH